MSHTSTSVVSAKNGSMQADAGSGIRHMSDSWIAFQPAIDEPSNIWPSEKVSSSIIDTSKVTCCHLPRGSVKRKSAYLTSLSLMSLRTSFAVVIECISLCLATTLLPSAVKLHRSRTRRSGSEWPPLSWRQRFFHRRYVRSERRDGSCRQPSRPSRRSRRSRSSPWGENRQRIRHHDIIRYVPSDVRTPLLR